MTDAELLLLWFICGLLAVICGSGISALVEMVMRGKR